MNISKCINEFINGSEKNGGRHVNERYSSFDYCYNYFYSFYENKKIEQISAPENIEKSCLQLGFYLASWGMLRGSSFLLEKSVKHLEKSIRLISCTDKILWEIDLDTYNERNIELVLAKIDELKISLGTQYNPTDTLTTKIMMGVFGNIPAFDQYFRRGLSVGVVNRKSLQTVSNFYMQNRNEIDKFEIYTLDFNTEKETKVKYTKAKIVDMYGFIAGV